MKILGILASSLLIALASCSPGGKEIEKKEVDPNAPPRFDSIDWKAEYKKDTKEVGDALDYQEKVSKFYQDFWQTSDVSGGLLVAKNGKIIFERYNGLANVEKNIPINLETPLHLASISKVFTSMAVLKLVEKEKIQLDQKVNTILADFPYDEIRVRDLLNHRSGLPNYANVLWNNKLIGKDHVLSNQEVLTIFTQEKVPLIRKLDTGFYYSNTNYVFLALIIEKIMKMDYPKAMKYMVFDPLNMDKTFVFDYEKDKDNVALSYGFKGKKWEWDSFDKTYGDKNIYSTPRDLLKLDMAMYSDKFLSKELKDEAFRGYSYEQKGVKNYGLGMRMLEFENGNRLLYHNGWWHGNYTVFVHDVNNQFTVIALGNKQNKNIYTAFRLSGISDSYPIELPNKDSVKVEKEVF